MVFLNSQITNDYDETKYAFELPKFIKITNLRPGELPFMKLRSPQVLRYHKFDKEEEQQKYYFSELQLYLPHNNDPRMNLSAEKNDFELCQKRFLSSQLKRVKSKIMEYLESVEEGLEKAKKLIENTVGVEMDSQNEQDKA